MLFPERSSRALAQKSCDAVIEDPDSLLGSTLAGDNGVAFLVDEVGELVGVIDVEFHAENIVTPVSMAAVITFCFHAAIGK